LMYLFEYRGRSIDLQYSKNFKLPPNLWFVGTMNTADRSIRTIDTALRRRLAVFECAPDLDALSRYYLSHNNSVPSLLDGLRVLNAELTQHRDRHHTIGHTFFMTEHMTPTILWRTWRQKIGPLLEEYFFDQPGLDGSELSAASTGGGSIGDASARRCQGAQRPGLCANPATRWRATSKRVDLGGGVGDA
jgi:5-methylcytosine-specific restriction protein B